MSPRRRNKKEEEFSSITALVPSVGTRLNPQRTAWTTHPAARAPVHQLSSHSAGGCPQPEKLLQSGECSSGPRRKPWDKARETLRHACDGGAASMQVTMHHRDTQVTRGPQGSDTSRGARLLLPLPHQPQRGSCSISLSFQKVALTFLPSLSSLCFFFPMQ